MNLSERKKDLIFFVIAAILGLASFIIPVTLNSKIKYYDSPLFPLIRTGIEGFSFFAMSCLVINGIILGFLNSRCPWRWGLATMAFFPILAIIEMIADPYSHNLWPIEFVVYGILSIPAVLGAIIGAFIKKNGVKNGIRIIFKFLFE